MTFTPGDVTLLVSAIGALIAAIGVAWANIITARGVAAKIEKAAKTVEEVAAKTDAQTTTIEAISAKADVISGHVNSAATASMAKIDGMQKELDLMRSLLSEKRETAALLAQATAAHPAMVANGVVTVEEKKP